MSSGGESVSDERERGAGRGESSSNELLSLCASPICFDPISHLTSVFFDRDNQQIFCVRSNGVGGVIVKGARAEHNMSFRLEDKGSVATIKFSPDLSVLAIRRKDKSAIDFLNFRNGQPASGGEYSQSFKARTAKYQECYWLDSCECLLVSEQGFEHYQLFADKRALKLVRFVPMALNWLIWSRDAQVFVISTGTYGSVLNPFVYTKANGAFVKLPKFEVDLPLPINMTKYRYGAELAGGVSSVGSSASSSSSSSGSASSSTPPTSYIPSAAHRYFLNESDVVVGRIYNEFYIMIIRQIAESRKLVHGSASASAANADFGYSEIAMYKLLTDSPAKKTNVLKINFAGRFTLNIIDDLIVVHHRTSMSSMLFDIKLNGEFDGYTTCNQPIIRRASIQHHAAVAAAASSSSLLFNMSPTTTSSEMYSINWIMFLPNVVIDAKLGYFWYIELNLASAQFVGERQRRDTSVSSLSLSPSPLDKRAGKLLFMHSYAEALLSEADYEADLAPLGELAGDYIKLVDFLLNRKTTKWHLLAVCHKAIRNKASLLLVEHIFDKINDVYKYSLVLYPPSQTTQAAANDNSTTPVAPCSSSSSHRVVVDFPVLDQHDIHNLLAKSFIDDDHDWWPHNSKYTIGVLVAYFRSLNAKLIEVEQPLNRLLVTTLIKAKRLYQLHQYLQYYVLSDSKSLACLLLALRSTYPAAYQLALDMFKRLGTANEEIIDALLASDCVLPALRLAAQLGMVDQLSAGKFLEHAAANSRESPLIFFEVFKFFEKRNVRQRGTPAFQLDENCEQYVQHFVELFQNRRDAVDAIGAKAPGGKGLRKKDINK